MFLALGGAAAAWPGLGQKIDRISHWPHFSRSIVVAAAVGFACQVAIFVLKGVTRRQTVIVLLEYLHRRSWGRDRGKNPDYRVSLWIPRMGWKLWQGRRLRCFHRTDGRGTSKSWAMKPPSAPDDNRDGHGPVGTVWLTEITMKVPGIGASASESAIAAYLQKTCMTRGEYDQLSWKGAAVAGISVRFSPDGDPIGVLLVECRLEGSEIDPNQIVHDPGMFSMVWEGRI